MSKTKQKRLGALRIITGEYTDQDGNTKQRYATVGELFGTPDHSRLSVKLPATAFSDEKWVNVYYDEGCAPNFEIAGSGDVNHSSPPEPVWGEF